MTQPSSSQPLTNNLVLKPEWVIPISLLKDEEVVNILKNTLTSAVSVGNGVYNIPIAPILDTIRRITKNEDESSRVLEFIRDNVKHTHSVEVGRVGDDDGNYIIMYPKGKRPLDFRKSKTNTLTVVELVKVALFSLENEIKPYQTVEGVKVTRSNLSTAREIAQVILNALPGIKVTNFADKYSVEQLDFIISKFQALKQNREKEAVIELLKDKGYSPETIERLIKT
jgi:hypothetical protein